MLRNAISSLCLLVGLAVYGQGLELRATPATFVIIPGEPVELTLVITNTSCKDLLLIGESARDALKIDSRLWRGDQQINCSMETGSRIEPKTPPSTWPKYLFKAGVSEIFQTGVWSHADCALRDVGPGQYTGRFTVNARVCAGSEKPQEVSVALHIPIEIKAASGEDAAYLQDLEKAAKTVDPSKIKGPSFEKRPLQWREVLQSWRVPVKDIIARHPTSIFAGYALRAPAVSFGCGTYDCFDNPEETLRKECDRGGGDKPTQACMQQEREKMRAYANAGAPFLETHPDFFDAPRIRRQYAYCLAFTGRVDEALDQVRILSKGEGELGKEAKSFLEKRTAKK
jgi:hypothetical protein